MDKDVSVCITSYNRFDLLKQTIDSFRKLNTYPIEKIIVVEDSTKLEMKDKIIKEYGDSIDLIYNEQRIGQAPSIDKMYATIKTKYIFHTEDDYLYHGSNPNFIKESIEILEERSNIHQVWVKHFSDFAGESRNQFENEILSTSGGIKYKMNKANFHNWCGFSFYPSLKRLEDYQRMFPNGYGHFITPEYLTSGAQTEGQCNLHAMSQGYRSCYLFNGTACSHTGINGRETYK